MNRRFFSPLPIQGDTCLLVGDEAHHLSRVLRARVGEQVILFDDSGYEFNGRITSIGRHEVQLVIIDQQYRPGELPIAVHLGVALPKGDRQKWLIEKAVELGVTSITPIVAQHGVAQPTDVALERLRRQGLEAAKQCARNRLMRIHSADALQSFCRAVDAETVRWIAHPYAAMLVREAMEVLLAPPPPVQSVAVLIGPEGGWTESEVQLAIDCGWQPISLGARILRVETAVCAIAAILAAAFDHPNG